VSRIRCYSAVVKIKTNRPPGTPGTGPVTEAGVCVEGSGGSETKQVT
jgi:hypothetical protein